LLWLARPFLLLLFLLLLILFLIFIFILLLLFCSSLRHRPPRTDLRLAATLSGHIPRIVRIWG